MPESLKEIGGSAFAGCSELTTVKLPSGSITYVVYGDEFNILGRDYYGRRTVRTFTGVFYSGGLVDEPDNGAFRNCPKLNIATRNAIEASGYKGSF